MSTAASADLNQGVEKWIKVLPRADVLVETRAMGTNENHERAEASAGIPGGRQFIVGLEPDQAAAGVVLPLNLPGHDGTLHPVSFRVPAGVSDGTLLKVPQRAGPGVPGSATEAFYVRVCVAGGTTPGTASPPAPATAARSPMTALRISARSGFGNRGKRGRALGVAALLVAAAGAVALAAPGRGGTDPGTAASTGLSQSRSGDRTPSPTITPALTLAEYAQTVNQAEADLAQGFRWLRTARTPSAVSSAATALSASLTAHTNTLRSVLPPEQVKAAHEVLLLGLNALGNNIEALAGLADDRAVCAGPSATATAARSDGAAQLRTALSALKAADPSTVFRIGSFLPRPAPLPERRLANSTLIKSTKRGQGQLTVKNGGDTDAVVTLTPSGNTTATVQVYVRGSSTAKVTRIPDGTYHVYMTFGTDWDTTGRLFTRTCAFKRFDQTANFQTTATTYSANRLTVTPVLNGNATTSDVDPEDFPTG